MTMPVFSRAAQNAMNKIKRAHRGDDGSCWPGTSKTRRPRQPARKIHGGKQQTAAACLTHDGPPATDGAPPNGYISTVEVHPTAPLGASVPLDQAGHCVPDLLGASPTFAAAIWSSGLSTGMTAPGYIDSIYPV
jgi:hypothetical protein